MSKRGASVPSATHDSRSSCESKATSKRTAAKSAAQPPWLRTKMEESSISVSCADRGLKLPHKDKESEVKSHVTLIPRSRSRNWRVKPQAQHNDSQWEQRGQRQQMSVQAKTPATNSNMTPLGPSRWQQSASSALSGLEAAPSNSSAKQLPEVKVPPRGTLAVQPAWKTKQQATDNAIPSKNVESCRPKPSVAPTSRDHPHPRPRPSTASPKPSSMPRNVDNEVESSRLMKQVVNLLDKVVSMQAQNI